MFSIICAVAKNRAIGKNNKLLWHIPEDMKHFRDITSGHTVIMGRKTFQSIGHALPDRKNIVITRDRNYKAENCEIIDSLEKAIEANKNAPSDKDCGKDNSPPLQRGGREEIFIIGGGSIYEQALPYCDRLYLTVIDDEPEADTFFPNYSAFKKIISEEEREYNGLKYKFVELTRD